MVASSEEGQSLLEFMFMLPLVIGLGVILIRINSTIQMSIVAQKYARSQILFLAQNSPEYPRRDQAEWLLAKGNVNQMIMGVRDDVATTEDATQPVASKNRIARSTKLAGVDSETPEEPSTRAYVRVRNTVSLCTPSLSVQTRSGRQKIGSQSLKEPFNPVSLAYCIFDYQGRVGRDLQ